MIFSFDFNVVSLVISESFFLFCKFVWLLRIAVILISVSRFDGAHYKERNVGVAEIQICKKENCHEGGLKNEI